MHSEDMTGADEEYLRREIEGLKRRVAELERLMREAMELLGANP
jgi:hypothetical protein